LLLKKGDAQTRALQRVVTNVANAASISWSKLARRDELNTQSRRRLLHIAQLDIRSRIIWIDQ